MSEDEEITTYKGIEPQARFEPNDNAEGTIPSNLRGYAPGEEYTYHRIARGDGVPLAYDVGSPHDGSETWPDYGAGSGTMHPQARYGAEQGITLFLNALGLNPDDDEHLRETPRRIVAMYRDELLNQKAADFAFTSFPAVSTSLIVQRDIEFVSVCSHHLLPFFGMAHVGYIPNKKMVGLSKLARAVTYCSRKPQVQEQFVEEVATMLEDELEPAGVAVIIEAEHMCMAIRGVRQRGVTTTTCLRGVFMTQPEVRQEFYDTVRAWHR